jgi:ketosteroid isomerase-like protein
MFSMISMKKLLMPFLGITLVAFAPCAHAQDSSGDANATKTKLKQMEDTWEKAFVDRDTTAIGNMIAEDFAGVDSTAKHRNKSQLLDEIKSESDTLSSATNDKMEVHVYGPSVATVVGTSTEKGTDKNGEQFNRTFGWVDTWMERDGKWECIAEAVTQIPEKK